MQRIYFLKRTKTKCEFKNKKSRNFSVWCCSHISTWSVGKLFIIIIYLLFLRHALRTLNVLLHWTLTVNVSDRCLIQDFPTLIHHQGNRKNSKPLNTKQTALMSKWWAKFKTLFLQVKTLKLKYLQKDIKNNYIIMTVCTHIQKSGWAVWDWKKHKKVHSVWSSVSSVNHFSDDHLILVMSKSSWCTRRRRSSLTFQYSQLLL